MLCNFKLGGVRTAGVQRKGGGAWEILESKELDRSASRHNTLVFGREFFALGVVVALLLFCYVCTRALKKPDGWEGKYQAGRRLLCFFLRGGDNLFYWFAARVVRCVVSENAHLLLCICGGRQGMGEVTNYC